ncbi:GFA family protein [Shimia sp. W99]
MTEPRHTEPRRTGRCECGAVRFETRGPLRPVIACHCGQCRRTSGHFWAATAVMREGLTMIADRGLRWFASSETARRGFCAYCGSSLFWDHESADTISIGAGTLDAPTGLQVARHIHVEDKGDYYDIACSAPQFEGDA